MQYTPIFEQGIAEFNNGQFFESHDTLEAIWMDLRAERKRFVQGLIQASVGMFHATRGNLTAAFSQLSKAIEKLGEFRPNYLGIDVTTLYDDLTRARGEVKNAFDRGEERFDPALVPRISYGYDPATMSDF